MLRSLRMTKIAGPLVALTIQLFFFLFFAFLVSLYNLQDFPNL